MSHYRVHAIAASIKELDSSRGHTRIERLKTENRSLPHVLSPIADGPEYHFRGIKTGTGGVTWNFFEKSP